jgi:hypothetical protein
MMKKTMVALVLAAMTAAGGAAYAHCGSCGVGESKGKAAAHEKGHHHGKGHDCKDGQCALKTGGCLSTVEGAEISVVENADGAVITVKGKGETVKKIQAAAARLAARECCGGKKPADKPAK